MDNLINGAQTLAEFSNLETDEIEAFCAAHPDFVPIGFLGGQSIGINIKTGEQSPSRSPWEMAQEVLRKTWAKRFYLDGAVRLITMADKSSQAAQLVDYVAWMTTADESAKAKNPWPEPKVWPFQRAVMYLAVNAWRAKFCSACGKRFIAATSKSKFCSDECFQDARKGAKRDWWAQHGSEQRRKKKK